MRMGIGYRILKRTDDSCPRLAIYGKVVGSLNEPVAQSVTWSATGNGIGLPVL
jgi:hypothetical protein